MKNILKGLFFASLMCLIFTACRDDAETPNPGPAGHPEIETAGVYEGTWTRQQSGKEEIISAIGTLTFEAGEYAYVTNITGKCPEIEFDRTTAANIAPGGDGYMFHNTLNTNGFLGIFGGSISKAGVASLKYQATVRDGRKTVTYIYTFDGEKK